ncbi:hypothetical protein BGZ95_001578 [Linnemannia exigua]|uniref:Uncharacterized protein n=1 Tax=Linnemannia exigua TaxID=604196 RepID=A0AAD4DIX6_9FUNG|nr:hypothetical protein BGZ95_001578 [Linnemannia exigua]
MVEERFELLDPDIVPLLLGRGPELETLRSREDAQRCWFIEPEDEEDAVWYPEAYFGGKPMPVDDRDLGMDPPNSDVVGEAPGAGYGEDEGEENDGAVDEEDVFGKLSSKLVVE